MDFQPGMEASPAYVGRRVPRVEDRPLLQGAGRYVDDVDRPGQLHARVVRSQVAHGRLLSVDTTAARSAPGVVAVITAEDLPDVRIPVRLRPTDRTDQALQPPLARDVVRYVGEPIAVVLATDPYAAEDAAEEVWAEIEAAPAVIETAAAADGMAPILHAALGGNVVDELRAAHGDGLDELFANADVVVEDRFSVGRHTAIPLETRGLVAELDGDGRLTVWGPAKVKHWNRRLLAQLLELPDDRVRFVEPDVGGGFGPRGEFYPEDFLIPWLALTTGRPVKWIEDRQEHFLATNHSREQHCDLAIAATADGRLLGFRARAWVDMGAYCRTHGLVLAYNTLTHLAGPYRWDAFEARAAAVLTNKTPAGTYRGPAQYEVTFHRERLLDRLAARIDVDPAELRRRNLVPAVDLPYTIELTGDEHELVYDTGDFPLLWERLLDAAGYDDLRQLAAVGRAQGELTGVGVAAFTEAGGLGPYEWAVARPLGDGGVVIEVGIASVGQGIATALSQIAADALGVPIERVTISHHDTDVVPEGLGAFSSRSTVFGGNAVLGAVRALQQEALTAAAATLGVAADAVEIVAGTLVRDRASPTRAVAMSDLGVEGRFRFEKHLRSFYMGATLATVTVDAETGDVHVDRIVVACDVGRAINPLIVEGQIHGAVAQGIGGALLEELVYDEGGQPQATSLLDYAMPSALDVPNIDAVVLELAHHRPESSNALGANGAGEAGIIGVGAAIANAVANALGPCGQELRALPLRPALLTELAGRAQS
jgi:carbon-monoxide dehydrogenase large subunit